jgi:hypothetical protein
MGEYLHSQPGGGGSTPETWRSRAGERLSKLTRCRSEQVKFIGLPVAMGSGRATGAENVPSVHQEAPKELPESHIARVASWAARPLAPSSAAVP